MHRRWFIASVAGPLLAIPGFARAQSRVARVAVLMTQLPAQNPIPVWWRALIDGLRDLGWEEGRNLEFQLRATAGIAERYRLLAAELVALKPDVIIAIDSQSIQAVHDETKTIPIIMIGPGNPVGTGFIASLARPGGNITGLSSQLGDLGGKVFQILKELSPGLSRIALFWTPDNPASKLAAEAELAVGPQYGLSIQSIPINKRDDLGGPLTDLARDPPEALHIHPTAILTANLNVIVNFALQQRILSFGDNPAQVRNGVLASYSPDPVERWRRAADYVDRILKGADPAEMPVEQPTKFEFAINLKTARAIGLDIPHSLLMRADEVIE